MPEIQQVAGRLAGGLTEKAGNPAFFRIFEYPVHENVGYAGFPEVSGFHFLFFDGHAQDQHAGRSGRRFPFGRIRRVPDGAGLDGDGEAVLLGPADETGHCQVVAFEGLEILADADLEGLALMYGMVVVGDVEVLHRGEDGFPRLRADGIALEESEDGASGNARKAHQIVGLRHFFSSLGRIVSLNLAYVNNIEILFQKI